MQLPTAEPSRTNADATLGRRRLEPCRREDVRLGYQRSARGECGWIANTTSTGGRTLAPAPRRPRATRRCTTWGNVIRVCGVNRDRHRDVGKHRWGTLHPALLSIGASRHSLAGNSRVGGTGLEAVTSRLEARRHIAQVLGRRAALNRVVDCDPRVRGEPPTRPASKCQARDLMTKPDDQPCRFGRPRDEPAPGIALTAGTLCMEPTGFEPVTSCLQTRTCSRQRATQFPSLPVNVARRNRASRCPQVETRK
jgi:hypothetical protein